MQEKGFMKDLPGAFIMAFSMYSGIPMPGQKWNEENMRYVFLFFPFVGALEGLLFCALGSLLTLRGYSAVFKGAVLALFTFLYTGGIHMDGFLDVSDAIGSYRTRDERLKILKDPHVGSFGVMAGILLILVKTVSYGELKKETLLLTGIAFFLSRTLSALSILCFKESSNKGTAFTFKTAAGKAVKPALIIYAILAAAGALYLSLKGGAALIILSVIMTAFHYYNSKRNFGGINGDSAGHFLELFETVTAFTLVVIFI